MPIPLLPVPLAILLASETATSTSATATHTATTAEFVKGEISNAGSIRLVPINSFVGVRLGGLIEDLTLYATIAPKIDLLLLDKKLRISVEVPLNFQVFSTRTAADKGGAKEGFSNFGTFRKQDWEICNPDCSLSVRKVVGTLRGITYGRKEDNFYLNLGQLYATTIGHGQAMRRYTANVDFNSYIVGGEIDAYGEYGGFEFALADVTRGNIFGALAFVKPLSFFAENSIARSWSLGASWSTDQKAPLALDRKAPVGAAMLGAVNVDETGQPKYSTQAVNVIGLDSEVKVYKGDTADLKVYGDFSELKDAGNGATLGLLGRFNFHGLSALQILRTRLELRSYDSNFQPSYFDVMYEFQKIEFITDPTNPNSPTKLAYITSRTGGRRFGTYAEVSYGLSDWFIVAAAIETDTTGQDRNLMLHAELPWKYLHVFATYQQRDFTKLFSLDENDLVFAGARIQILPILFLNGRAQRNLSWDPARYAGLGGYSNQTKYLIDAEFGFEF